MPFDLRPPHEDRLELCLAPADDDERPVLVALQERVGYLFSVMLLYQVRVSCRPGRDGKAGSAVHPPLDSLAKEHPRVARARRRASRAPSCSARRSGIAASVYRAVSGSGWGVRRCITRLLRQADSLRAESRGFGGNGGCGRVVDVDLGAFGLTESRHPCWIASAGLRVAAAHQHCDGKQVVKSMHTSTDGMGLRSRARPWRSVDAPRTSLARQVPAFLRLGGCAGSADEDAGLSERLGGGIWRGSTRRSWDVRWRAGALVSLARCRRDCDGCSPRDFSSVL